MADGTFTLLVWMFLRPLTDGLPLRLSAAQYFGDRSLAFVSRVFDVIAYIFYIVPEAFHDFAAFVLHLAALILCFLHHRLGPFLRIFELFSDGTAQFVARHGSHQKADRCADQAADQHACKNSAQAASVT